MIRGMVRMNRNRIWATGLTVTLAATLTAGSAGWAQAPAATVIDFTKYVGTVETRLASERQSDTQFLGGVDRDRLRKGEVVIEKLVPAQDADPPGGMLHDWRGTAFAPGAKAADFERLMRDFPAYPTVYAPQVVRAAVASYDGDHYAVTMRVKQKHMITVVMDTAYDVEFGKLDGRGWSTSRSTSIKEIENAETEKERALGPGEDHGFLWRLNTYWTYEERDGGVLLELEAIALTREEIARRVRDLLEGRVKPIPADEVFELARQRARRRD